MIWSRDRFNTLRNSAGRGMICAGVAALALGVAVPLAMAQQTQTPGVPKTSQAPNTQAAPAAAGAPAAPAAAGGPDYAWFKLCFKN
jgi:hypothetical protein